MLHISDNWGTVNPMLLLHISDIHFRAPNCLNPDLDADRPFRTRLLQDARARATALGPVGAILVGGDIAFKGDPQEYQVAFAWIKELAEACQCPLERVFVIPGNHDVDRSIIMRAPSTRNAQQAIKTALPQRREGELRTQFADQDAGKALLAPLAAYNEFAKLFNCQVYPPERLYWKQDLPLQNGVHLRIHGLTSTLLSGANGQDDQRDLYLSPLQTVLDPVEDVVNLVLCHHPPDWFLDHDEVHDDICGRAAIHLFGHKHRQRVTQEVGYIRFAAGAVNPDRNEPGWRPGYNLIRVDVHGAGPDRALDIEAHLLEWQASPEQYRPILTARGDPVLQQRIAIPARVAAPARAVDKAEAAIAPPAAPPEADADVEAAMGDEGTRNLVFRFWNLTISQRRDIARRLGLIEEDELGLPEPERYGRALRRAGERGLLDQLAREIAELERQ